MKISDLIGNQETYAAQAHELVHPVVQEMVVRNIGAVPVLREGRLVGIFSERDLMGRVVAAGRDPQTTRVEEVMTAEPLTVGPSESVENSMIVMRRYGFRHLPVCDCDRLIAIVSLRDILLHDLVEKDYEVRMMRAYIQASPEM